MKISFIGGGKMVKEMVRGFNRSGLTRDNMGIWLRNKDKLQTFSTKHNITPLSKMSEIVDYDAIVLGVTPNNYRDVTSKLSKHLCDHHIIISIVGGLSIQEIDDEFDEHPKIIRLMPNTPVGVNAGVLAMSKNEFVEKKEAKQVEELLKRLGYTHWIDESLMHLMPAVTGSSPTFIYLLVEAMADNAVSEGLNRELAYQMVSEMIIGAGTMVRQTKEHPGVLKDQVTTPGGSTIQGVKMLEEKGFRDAISKAMDAINAYNKA
ncbi:pyrroline-5-carboxylate reductase [Macrococcoides caseolyticum]|uniref:pyrroline-5-carboxylate reductase n=1 Tax=Macrococcoides caseolyticum TaxID=69966 RepID=UPI001F39E3AA|nr:pyrroline-5-carboxylate reductase [Macrococcus caseolyticus]MCE4956452.1 pyrroline-5-carboxylate reductase [Macrococcus caseolyticus]